MTGTGVDPRWREVRRLFDEALERPPEGRSAWLEEACGGNDILRREVLDLLEADATGSAILDDPAIAIAPLVDEDVPSMEGRLVGPYRVRGRIGSGGMGTVYEAERADHAFERRVAIKFVRTGIEGEHELARFRRERAILAGLDHPNIAGLLDGGVIEGRPYFVLEHVEGDPIDRHCRERALPVEERLGLFTEVCDAVAFAHRNLVVHRDLKPSNVLVTSDGNVKLLDFGVAKLLEEGGEPGLTATGALVATPEYASPEQVRGDPISTATDVWQLGAILYELLAGRPPYPLASRAPAELARTLERPPVPPSTAVRADAAGIADIAGHVRSVRGDLDHIVLMALRSEPERRYGSVGRLRDDVERHLAGLPVRAGPATLTYRAKKFLGRHRAAAVASGAGLTALVGGVLGIVREARRTEIERRTSETVTTFLQRMLGSVDPREDGRDVRVVEILDRAAEKIGEELEDRPEVASRIHATLGRTYRGLGLLEQAERHARAALEAVPRSRRSDDERLAALRELGVTLDARGEYEQAERLLRAAVARARERGGGARLQLAGALADLGVLLNETGRDDEAESSYRGALEIYDDALDRPDERVAAVLNSLGVALGNRGPEHGREAEHLHRRALEIFREVHGDRHPDVAYTLYNVAGAIHIQRRFEEAERVYRETLALRRELLGERHPHTILTATSVANALWGRGEFEGAIEAGREAYARAREALPDTHPLVAYAAFVLGESLLDSGRPEEAEPLLREAVGIRRDRLPGSHWLVANAESTLGAALVAAGRSEEGGPLLVRGYRRLRAERGPRHEKTRLARRRLRAAVRRRRAESQAGDRARRTASRGRSLW